MTLAEYSLTAFALFNGGRVVAYVPQMIRVYRDPNGATAVSLMTWILFAAANVATVLYALIISNDRVVAVVFGLNALGCAVVVGLTAIKRIRFKHRSGLCALRSHTESDLTAVLQRTELPRRFRSWPSQ